MNRRDFVQHAFALPFLASDWKSAPPTAYLAELRNMMRAAPVPGAMIGAVRDHKVAWLAPLGVRTAGSTDPITNSTLFQAASLTKQIAAHAAFALRAQKRLDFDRPLVTYLDDLPNAQARAVTTRQVLSHSSGFPNWRFTDGSKPVPDLTPAFTPGSRYQYSGEGYFYLQRVMERITGDGIGEIVRKLVFEPLGMTSSTLVWNPETLSRTASPHNSRGEVRTNWEKSFRALHAYAEKVGKPINTLRYDDYAAAAAESGGPVLPNGMRPNAAASLVTSAEDYGCFLAVAIRNPELGQQQVVINEFLGWGLGWAIERAAGHSYLWQWGDNPGFKNFVLAEPSTGSAIFIFTNGDAGARVYDRVLTHATGHDHPALFWL